MADMGNILAAARGSARGGDDRAVTLLAIMQALQSLGKTATGVADWMWKGESMGMRREEAQRAKERFKREKGRWPTEDELDKLRIATGKFTLEESKRQADRAAKRFEVEMGRKPTEDELLVLRLEAARRAAEWRPQHVANVARLWSNLWRDRLRYVHPSLNPKAGVD